MSVLSVDGIPVAYVDEECGRALKALAERGLGHMNGSFILHEPWTAVVPYNRQFDRVMHDNKTVADLRLDFFHHRERMRDVSLRNREAT